MGVDLKPPSRRARVTSRAVRGGAYLIDFIDLNTPLSFLMGVDLKPPSRRSRGEPAGSPRSSRLLKVYNGPHFELSRAQRV